ncbi:hypothetical protein HMPREF9104_00517 [Lentilactobacillus kisonensis F0435]|uniref:Uncharacterized protein n=1 Tax=Lentilactobacillus kisonensis F0435 TaxID=797516 RepID=H1LD53_9LACO|nr:hypothetical protein HMPREF9104_00517 [Lentilactobacillus kisonensis F0435]
MLNTKTVAPGRNLRVSTYRINSKPGNLLDKRLTLRFLTAWIRSLLY